MPNPEKKSNIPFAIEIPRLNGSLLSFELFIDEIIKYIILTQKALIKL